MVGSHHGTGKAEALTWAVVLGWGACVAAKAPVTTSERAKARARFFIWIGDLSGYIDLGIDRKRLWTDQIERP